MKKIVTRNKIHLLSVIACLLMVVCFVIPASAAGQHYLRPYQTSMMTVYMERFRV